MRVVLIAVTSLLLLTGCGQKGPLYLPQDQSFEKPAIDQDDKPGKDQSDQ